MGKVTFEFDETEDRYDIQIIANRYKLLKSLEDICSFIRKLYNCKIYDNVIIEVKDNKILSDVDLNNMDIINDEKIVSYINKKYVEDKLFEAVEEIKDIID